MGKRVKKSLSTLKLYDKIVLSATVILIIISLIFTVVSIDNITKSKIEEVEQYLTTLTMDFKDNVDGFLKEKIDLLKFIASFPEIYNMNWDEQYKFLKEKTIYSKFEHMFIVDNEGYGYYVQSDEIKEQSHEEFFQNIKDKEEYITEPFLEEYQNRSITTISVAIYNNGNRVGTLCGALNLKEINDKIQSVKVKKSGFGFVINNNGNYVVSNDMNLVHNKINIFELENYDATLLDSDKKNDNGLMVINGENYYANYSLLDGVPWKVVFVVSVREVLEGIRNIKYLQYFSTMLFIILLGLIVRIIAKYIRNDKLVYIDSLTQIANRNKCNYIFTRIDNGYKEDLAIISIDLNDFKIVNDTMGHNVGDELLCDFAKILKLTFEKYGFIGRMGGDEFIVILSGYDVTKVKKIIREFNNNILSFNTINNKKYKISASCGYAIRKKDEIISLKEVYKKADKNMYLNKRELKLASNNKEVISK